MGCAVPRGKKEQHSLKFVVNQDKCTGCEECISVCPESAISLQDGRAFIDNTKCIGCGECMGNCPVQAQEIDWRTEITPFNERLVEYAYGVLQNKKDKAGYINFLINITPNCDCFPWSDMPIVPDIGILASKDPVAIDRASFDLVNKQTGFKNTQLKSNHEAGLDKFKGMRPHTNSYVQIEYGQEIGLGQSDYNLIDID